MKKYIAFQTVEIENNIWSNTALLFNTEQEAIDFFFDPSRVFKVLGYELEEGETFRNIRYTQSFTGVNMPHEITFECKCVGEVRIAEMGGGYVIK